MLTWIEERKCLPGKEKRGASFKIAKSLRASDRTKNISPCSLPKASFKQEFLCPLMTLLKEPSSLLRKAISHTYKKNRNYGNLKKGEKREGCPIARKMPFIVFSLLFRAAATPFQFTGFFLSPHSSPRKCINLKRLQILVLPTKAAHPFLSLFCSEENLIKSRRVIFFAVNFGGTGDPLFLRKSLPFSKRMGN